MDFEQILIRLGVDAKAAMMGMTSFKSWAKGWATDFASTLKHHLLGTVGAGAALFGIERLFESFKERALFVQRMAKETGLTTNMVQGMANELGYVGESFESISKPLGKFAVLIGQAKEGIPAARQKLIEWGIATKSENWNNLTLTSGIVKLAQEFDRLGTHEAKAALLQSVFGKQWQSMMPIFEQGARAVEKMNEASGFKFTPETLRTFQDLFTGEQSLFKVITAKLANNILGGGGLGVFSRLVKNAYKSVTDMGGEFGPLHMGGIERLNYILHGTLTEEQKHNETLRDKKELLEQNLKIQQLANEAANLQNSIDDRRKLTVGELANRARELMGRGAPIGLESIYSVTPAMAAARQIETLEGRAKAALAMGNKGQSDALYNQSDQLRLRSGFLKSTEQDPAAIARQHLDALKSQLLLMQGMGGSVSVHLDGVSHKESIRE
jgi:hypothetical protein